MKFVFIAKHRHHLAGGMAMQCDGRIPVGLPCLAEPLAQRQIPKRRDRWPAGQGKFSGQRPDLRRTACLARPFGRRHRMRSASDRAADAPAGCVSAWGLDADRRRGHRSRINKIKTLNPPARRLRVKVRSAFTGWLTPVVRWPWRWSCAIPSSRYRVRGWFSRASKPRWSRSKNISRAPDSPAG